MINSTLIKNPCRLLYLLLPDSADYICKSSNKEHDGRELKVRETQQPTLWMFGLHLNQALD